MKQMVGLAVVTLTLGAATLASAGLRPPPITGADAPVVPIQVSEAGLRRALENDNYREVTPLETRRRSTIFEACRGDDRYRLEIDAKAKIRSSERQGVCRNGKRAGRDDVGRIDPGEIEPILRARGYSAVRVIDWSPPGFKAEGCRGGDRFRLSLSRSGDIASRDQIGACDLTSDEALKSEELPAYLRSRGYRNVTLIDRTGPRYQADACRGDSRYRVTVNKAGTITDGKRLGTCGASVAASNLTGDDARNILRQRSYYDVKIVNESRNSLSIEGCRGVRRFRVDLERDGEVASRERIGWCAPEAGRTARVGARRISDRDLNSKRRLSAQDCQDYLDYVTDSASILFEVASADVGRDSYEQLRRVARVLKRCPRIKIEVAGHTDADGSSQDNKELSRARARSVAKFLISEGVEERRLEATGYGEKQPIAGNSSAADKSLNRRIEFVLDWQS